MFDGLKGKVVNATVAFAEGFGQTMYPVVYQGKLIGEETASDGSSFAIIDVTSMRLSISSGQKAYGEISSKMAANFFGGIDNVSVDGASSIEGKMYINLKYVISILEIK